MTKWNKENIKKNKSKNERSYTTPSLRDTPPQRGGGLTPKKSLGQHFLRSDGALNKIVESAELNKGDVVLEVGPGEGVLTEKLLKVARVTLAIEKDRRSIEFFLK